MVRSSREEKSGKVVILYCALITSEITRSGDAQLKMWTLILLCQYIFAKEIMKSKTQMPVTLDEQ